ncbi:DUF1624 domain-containing protein [candidate division WWE3 bacterium]|uniref:DUF1624 domain-containing protein n=1 Tax=candidate division WWE3 bacterium TaxID=2053526 RepID=A0A955LV40_UNCKA|nr:DUF1624 domain-containing protein [candidate division WWE3 bacterium]
MKVNSNRDYSLDFLRGLAVIFMIITHVIAIFYTGNNNIIDWFEWWGATICFTTFLFVFSVLYGLKLSKDTIDTTKQVKRFVTILISYYAIALWVSLFYKDYSITNILLFVEQPEFTEFIITFGWYILIISLFQKQLKPLLNRPLTLFIIGILLYSSSLFLYNSETSNLFTSLIKSQLVGYNNWHTFGVLTYSPVFFMGLWWGNTILHDSSSHSHKISKMIATITAGLLLLTYFFQLSTWHRWPPSALFLLYGIAFCWIIVTVWPYVKTWYLITSPILSVGQKALTYYFGHLIILMPLILVIPTESVPAIETAMLVIAIFALLKAFILLPKRSHWH